MSSLQKKKLIRQVGKLITVNNPWTLEAHEKLEKVFSQNGWTSPEIQWRWRSTGGKAGHLARMKSTTKKQRSDIARKAALAMHAKRRLKKGT